jgi:hypothetical protein
MMVCTDPLPKLYDFRRRGGAAVDQHHDRQAGHQVALAGVVALGLVLVPASGRHDLALVEEGVGHGDCLVEQAAGVVAQVEHQTLQLVAGLRLDLGDGLFEAGRGLLAEAGDPDVADVAVQARAHRLDLDDRPGQGDVERLGVGALDGELDVGVDRPAHALHRLGQSETEHCLAVQVGDVVAGLDAGGGGRGVVEGRHHLDQPVLHGDFDAEPAELAAGLHLHLLIALRIEVARMGVELGQHTVDRILDQLLVGDLFHVVGAHPLEHIAEQVELAIGFRAALGRGGERREQDDGGGQSAQQAKIAHRLLIRLCCR